jgi:hypothetical protein
LVVVVPNKPVPVPNADVAPPSPLVFKPEPNGLEVVAVLVAWPPCVEPNPPKIPPVVVLGLVAAVVVGAVPNPLKPVLPLAVPVLAPRPPNEVRFWVEKMLVGCAVDVVVGAPNPVEPVVVVVPKPPDKGVVPKAVRLADKGD